MSRIQQKDRHKQGGRESPEQQLHRAKHESYTEGPKHNNLTPKQGTARAVIGHK